MNELPGKPPPERTVSNIAAQASQNLEASIASYSQPRTMAAVTARPFPPTLPPILLGHDTGPRLPPLGRPSDINSFPPPLTNPSTGPVSPTSTVSSRTSHFYPPSQIQYGNNTSPSRPYAHYNPSTMPNPGKRPRSPTSTYSNTTGTAYGISHSTPQPGRTGPRPDITTSHIVAPTSIPKERFKLHLRQQPRAARAGPDGKDRRTIDPPPVLQILINDFESTNKVDNEYLKANDWVVHAKLISAYDPPQDMNTLTTHAENTQKIKVTRLLLGTTVSSPFYCTDDPDRDNAPKHPATKAAAPSSPTMLVLGLPKPKEEGPGPDAHKDFPGTYFIFADLSVRKAGQYRLEFRLMKMEPPALQPGRVVPTISVIVSDVFNVVNAKDFDQVQPSTNLVKGLLDRGAGFPLKLKKGLREGQRRKNPTDDSDDDGDGDGDGEGDGDADGDDDTVSKNDDDE